MATQLRDRALRHVQMHEARQRLQAALAALGEPKASRAVIKDHVARAEMLINDEMPEATGLLIDELPTLIQGVLTGMELMRVGARAQSEEAFSHGFKLVDRGLEFLLAIILLRERKSSGADTCCTERPSEPS